MAVIDTGSDTPGKSNVDAQFNLRVNTPGYSNTGVAVGGGPENGPAEYSEVDGGTLTGARLVRPNEVNADFALRVAQDTLLDYEKFNYTAQNTGKYNYLTSTMAIAWSALGMTTNSGSSLTALGGARVRSYAAFPIVAASQTYVEWIGSVLALPSTVTNTEISIGLFIDGGAAPFAPTDGVYFRLTDTGVRGEYVISGNPPQPTPMFTFPLVAGVMYRWLITINNDLVEFWIDNILCGSLPISSSDGAVLRGVSAPFAIRQAIGAANANVNQQFRIVDYSVTLGGGQIASSLEQQGNRAYGAHQGLGGGTMGSLALYANNTTAVALAVTNTTAAFTGLGGQAHIIAQAATALPTQNDNILISFQVPQGTALIQGRRLAIRGVWVGAVNLGAIVATTTTVLEYALNFGHTAVSLATAEGAAAKAPRREALGFHSWQVGAAIGSPPAEGRLFQPFTAPIFVNPGEFVQVSGKFVTGTATAAQTIFLTIGFDYGWE